MRKKMTVLLAVLLAATLVSCSGKNAGTGDTPAPDESATVPAETTPGMEQNNGQETPGETMGTGSPDETDPEDPENVMLGDREDTLTVTVEGKEQAVPAIRHTSWMGYAMTYDPALLKLFEREDGDVYFGEWVEGRPNVYISVSLLDGLTAEEAVEGLRRQNNITEEGETVAVGRHSYAATYLRMSEGAGSNDAVVEFYVTEQNDTVFLIEVGNFVDGEAEFGAPMRAMLDTVTF